MSYDINFWRLERPLTVDPVEIYRRLSKGEIVDGLARLPVSDICDRLKVAFPAFDPKEEFPSVVIDGGSIQMSWSERHFRFDLRGEWDFEAQKIVEIMAYFHCPLFDPQITKRYDADNGMTLGNLPSFTKTRSGEKYREFAAKAGALQKLRLEVLGRIEAKAKSSSRPNE